MKTTCLLCSQYGTHRVDRRAGFEKARSRVTSIHVPRYSCDVMNETQLDAEEDLDMSPEELADLDAALEEADRGEGMDAFEFLRQLRAGTWRDPVRSKDEEASSEVEYELTSEDENALEDSVAEIERGECVTAKDLLTELRAQYLRECDDDLWPLLISQRARCQIAEAQQCWLQDRETSSEALEGELKSSFEVLLETPAIGGLVPT